MNLTIEPLTSKQNSAKIGLVSVTGGESETRVAARNSSLPPVSASDLGQFERGINDSLGTGLVLEALQKATFNDAGKAPVTKVGKETYTTIAHANYVNSGTSSIDFYDPFFKQGSTGQYQTAIHEAMHLIWNIGDDNFARAVGIEGKTGLAASAAWHEKLTEKCK